MRRSVFSTKSHIEMERRKEPCAKKHYVKTYCVDHVIIISAHCSIVSCITETRGKRLYWKRCVDEFVENKKKTVFAGMSDDSVRFAIG